MSVAGQAGRRCWPTGTPPGTTFGVVAASERFLQLLSDHAVVGFERQMALADLVAGHAWELADADAGEITFSGLAPFAASLLGTEAAVEPTWLWGWANQAAELPESAASRARQLRDLSAARNVVEFRNPRIIVDPVLYGHTISLAAVGALGARAYFRTLYRGGAAFWLIDDPQVPVPKWNATRCARMIEGGTQLAGIDTRRAVWAYLLHHGAEAHWIEASRRITADMPDAARIIVTYDPDLRVERVEVA